MCAKGREAFSLIESLIAMLLLAGLIAVVSESIRWAFRSHRTGEAHRQSVQLGREALNKISQELATSISVGLLPSGGELASGVAYPDYAVALNQPFSGSVYRREHTTRTIAGGTSVAVDRAYNRLILTLPGKKLADFKDSLTEYVFLEYVVPPKVSDAALPQHRLYRRPFRFQADPLASTIPGLETMGNYQVVRSSFFALDPADPLGNPQMIGAALNLAQRQERCLVMELPRPEDEIQFSVEHDAATLRRTSPLPRDPAYEPSLFTVTVKISLDNQGNNKFLASHLISQQVTIKSGF